MNISALFFPSDFVKRTNKNASLMFKSEVSEVAISWLTQIQKTQIQEQVNNNFLILKRIQNTQYNMVTTLVFHEKMYKWVISNVQ